MAKSSFWDDLGNALTRKAKGLSSKAENLYEIQKIRNKLSAQERMTEKLMMDIGKMIYTRYEHGEAVDGEVGAICEEISQHMLEADHFRDAIAASKGEKFCPACHKAVMREASFCPYCGAACPTAELEEKATDVIEQAEEELKDAADAEVTEAEEVTEAAEETEATATPEATEETEATTTPEVTEAASYNTDSSLEVTDGNKVNIDYVGKIDGVAFDGGSTDGKGTDLVIGSGTYIDNFEEQLIGAHPGDKVEVTVVFPDDYQAADLAGKEAVFDVTVNGIYE